jgi:tetratricopeptide (TPR) repeat protein
LAQELGYLPLAKGVSFAAYWRSYQKKRLQLLEKEQPQVGNYPDSVATTWAINFEAVKASSLAAADLLNLSAFLAPDNIPYELLILGKDHLGELLRQALADAADDELVLPELLEELTRYSLIRLETDYRYSIHRMVQEVLRDGLEETQQQQWRDQAVEALNEVFPSPEFENWWLCERLIEQVQAIDRQTATQTTELARLLICTGYFLKEQGRYSEAEPYFLQALHIYQTQLGEAHPDTATSLDNLAALYQFQGRYSKAEPYFLQALHIYQTQLGEAHPDTATSLNNLAALYQFQGRYSEAELYFLQALQIRQTQLGEAHPDTAGSLSNLALLYKSQGRYSEAEPLYLQTLAILMQKLGENYPNTQTVLGNFVYFLQQVIAAGRSPELSDHPVTQTMLEQLQAG